MQGAVPSSTPEPDILSRIVGTKEGEVRDLARHAERLRREAEARGGLRDFPSALEGGQNVAVIAEVKRRSPGAGAIRPDLDPVARAAEYEAGGARALSVLTDETYFQGSIEDLARVRTAVSLPVLRKDFVIDPVQVWEARAAGADAVLLIVRILDDGRLRDLRLLAEELGMSALVEVHDEAELHRALASGARIVGVNNRDLRTFSTDVEVTLRLADRVPGEVILVSESGISRSDQVERLADAGVDAILVGEALVRAGDPAEAVRSLSGVPRGSLRSVARPCRRDR
jgi:indole-3-glycerol phosphate synthase